MKLDAMFSPRGVAVYGSTGAGKLGAVLIGRLIEGGFSNVYAVNPKGAGCGAVKGYTDVSEIAAPVDLAVIASPAATVPGVLESCGKAGVRAAVIITSGFAEAHHPELEEQVIETAKRYGIRYIGPNCSGLVNTHASLYPTLEEAPDTGSLGIISQSGAVAGLICAMSRKLGVGISKSVSFGNGSNLNELELLKYMKDDPETKVIAVYAENIKRGREFIEVVSSITPTKPVVVIKSGRTSSGQRAALSHTGSLAGADSVYDAAFDAAGAIRADSVPDMLDICKGLCLLSPMQGSKLAIITNSGGPGVMSADACEREHLALPRQSDALTEKLSGFLPAFAGLANPIDVTVEGTAEQYGRSTETMLNEFDGALVIYIGTPYLEALPVAKSVADAARASGKPVACYFEVGVDIAEANALLDNSSCPCFDSGERGVRALAKCAQYYTQRKAAHTPAQVFEKQKLDTDLPALLEYQSMQLFASHGIPVPKNAFVTCREDIPAAAKEIGYPLCVKVVSPQILHKSDVGGVKLNIRTEADALAAFDHMRSIAEGKDFRGVMLYPMLDKGAELIVGFSRDKQFGPVVMCGMGGIYTEILKDVSLRIAPVTPEAALDMLHSLKTWPLLNGARGAKPVDVNALSRLIAALSELPLIYPELSEGEMNPVFAYESGVLAADARLIVIK